MKTMFLVFILFLNTNGTVEVMKLPKCYGSGAASADAWMSDPKNWEGTTLPLDHFVTGYQVTEEKWYSTCYSTRNYSEAILYPDGMLLLPRLVCPWGEQ